MLVPRTNTDLTRRASLHLEQTFYQLTFDYAIAQLHSNDM